MKRDALHKVLKSERFPDFVYDLNGGYKPEAYTIGQRSDKWVFYYSEHGLESGFREFKTEDEACEYILAKLRREVRIRQGM
jgi:hypothetical protein